MGGVDGPSILKGIDEKVTGLSVWHAALPVVSQRDHGIGSVADSMEVVVVRLESESGEAGFGEASPWSVFTGTPEASYAAIDRYFRPLLVGARIGDVHDIMQRIQRIVVHCTEAKAAVESALLDLAGKLTGQPVWRLLGDACRTSVPLSVSIANPDFDQDLELMERLTSDGVGIVKLKTGFRDDAFDIKRAETIRKRFPEFRLRIDYNQGLASRDALNSVKQIEAFSPDFIEQPVVAHDFDTMAKIHAAIETPLLADESVFGAEDMRRAIRENICDGVSIKIMKSGGLIRGMEVAETAATAKLPAYGGDMFETGLAHLAGLHMLAVSPNISLGCEFYHSRYYLVEDLLVSPLEQVEGKLVIPDSPGLGSEIRVDLLEKYTVNKNIA